MLILLALSLITRFMFFGYPSETVFDEVHFGKFISGYYTREYFFDIHPPGGKLAIAGFAKLFDFKPGFAFSEIGNEYPDKQYLILRFLPSLAGALLPLVIFLLLVELGISRSAAFWGGLLIVFENAILTQSHYILLDSLLLLFGFLSLLFYFKSKNYFLLFGLFSGLAISIKWTGLGFLALPLFVEFIQIIKNKNPKQIIEKIIFPLIVAVFVYSVIFLTHLVILDKSGPGNNFMSPGFQKTLSENRFEKDSQVKKSNLFQKFTELNAEMYKSNQRLTAQHPYSSSWYSWPFMARPIYYWVNENARIYFIGNPVIWWLSTVTVIFALISLIQNLRFKIPAPLERGSLNKVEWQDSVIVFLTAGYVVNVLPFIGVKRVMFLYHYLTAYIFALMILVWFVSQQKNSEKLFRALIIASVISFIFFAPLSYGLDLSPNAYEYRVWFSSWR
ncbi:MAG: hypothetical protein A2910_00805 [Candidatus Yanofskybacteria bacterium RIFCSPLOWO2_01_FULL_39_28]|nr:MAG: hypothetical protein A2910_00805 [Candidatus Yanofskybacteria bacterium RIFCSPLOWO2_01_FULL_39_28]